MTACDVFPPHLRHSIRPLGSVAGITRRAALRLSRTYRLTVLGDVIGADGRIDLAPVDGSGDQELKDAVSKALLALIASVTKASSGFVSASELLVESSGSALKTFQENLDALFGGPGIPLGTITEIAGKAGLGKTQICLQLCATVQVPAELGGLGGRAVYLDTEGDFCGERMAEVGEATKRDVLAALQTQERNAFEDHVFTDSVFYKRIQSLEDLVKVVCSLEDDIIKKRPGIRLVVVDSIAYHFRYLDDEVKEYAADFKKRTPKLYRIAQILGRIAHEYGIAVVLTNQMTTKFQGKGALSTGRETPCLGKSWSHCSTQRVILSRHPSADHIRVARLAKSPITDTVGPRSVAPYCITPDGIRDLE